MVKLSGNFISFAAAQALREVLRLAKKSGIDPLQIVEMFTQTLFPIAVYQHAGKQLALDPKRVSRSWIAVKDVGLFEEMARQQESQAPLADLLHRLLGNHGDARANRGRIGFSDIDSIEQYPSAFGIVESLHELEQGRLAGSGWPDECHRFTFADDGAIPNSKLPMLVYRAAVPADPVAIEKLFAADDSGKVAFVVATTAPARDAGLAAGKLVPVFAPVVGGRGGGKPDLAQGGGTDPSGVPAAIDALRRELAGR